MSPIEGFLIVWASAAAGACGGEFIRQRWEAHKYRNRRKLGSVSSDWMPRIDRRGR